MFRDGKEKDVKVRFLLFIIFFFWVLKVREFVFENGFLFWRILEIWGWGRSYWFEGSSYRLWVSRGCFDYLKRGGDDFLGNS